MSADTPTPRRPPGRPRKDLASGGVVNAPVAPKVPADPATDEPQTEMPANNTYTVSPREYVVGGTAGSGALDVPAPAPEPQPDMRALIAQLREELKAELRAKMAAAAPETEKSPKSPTSDVEAASRVAQIERQALRTAPEDVLDPQGVLIHFVNDGMTIGGRMFYRGEELVAPKDAPWLNLTGAEQSVRFGRRMFRLGPWDGDEFNVDDPTLTQSDRARLLAAAKRRQELHEQWAG
jgi:hypothetical protein